eukprot:310496-Chlamydomonas_euryale.AAC.4
MSTAQRIDSSPDRSATRPLAAATATTAAGNSPATIASANSAMGAHARGAVIAAPGLVVGRPRRGRVREGKLRGLYPSEGRHARGGGPRRQRRRPLSACITAALDASGVLTRGNGATRNAAHSRNGVRRAAGVAVDPAVPSLNGGGSTLHPATSQMHWPVKFFKQIISSPSRAHKRASSASRLRHGSQFGCCAT